MNIDELIAPGDKAGLAAAIEAELMDRGYLVFAGSRLQAIGRALSSWTAFTGLPMEVRQRFHHSVKDGEASGGWSLMR